MDMTIAFEPLEAKTVSTTVFVEGREIFDVPQLIAAIQVECLGPEGTLTDATRLQIFERLFRGPHAPASTYEEFKLYYMGADEAAYCEKWCTDGPCFADPRRLRLANGRTLWPAGGLVHKVTALAL